MLNAVIVLGMLGTIVIMYKIIVTVCEAYIKRKYDSP